MGIFFDSSKINEILEEGKSTSRGLSSEFERLYGHMLKLKYQKETYLQSNTWVDTIIDASNIINEKCKNGGTIRAKAINELQFKGYKDGIKLAIKDTKGKLTERDMPKELPPEWEFSNITNIKFIFNFMDKYTVPGNSAYKQLQDKKEEYKEFIK